jgi:hypothetical protein
LQNKFNSIGVSCVINIGPLNSRAFRLISRLVSLHKFPNFIRSIIYAFDGVGDFRWYRRFTSQVVIQISSPMRSWAYSIVHRNHLRTYFTYLIRKSLPKYDFVCYLTAPYSVRLKRHTFQVGFKQNPDRASDRFPNSGVFSQMEVELINLLNKYNSIKLRYDTNVSNYEDITDNIISTTKDKY